MWDVAPADGWRRFFGETADAYEPTNGSLLVDFFFGKFRDQAPYKTWSRSAPLRDPSGA